MTKTSQLAGLLTLAVLLQGTVLAQGEEKQQNPAPGSSTAVNKQEKASVESGQEVEINEDNYRQFMELKDGTQQRAVLPENAYQPRSGMQKLDELPEASQKHLREQLREVIVNSDQWQPGDENKEYPYEPSAAATGNPALAKQEAEAWGELVDGYHQREAQIHDNSARANAAGNSGGEIPGPEGSAGQAPQNMAGQMGGQMAGQSGSQAGGQAGEGEQGSQQNQQGQPGQQSRESQAQRQAQRQAQGAARDPNAKSTEGVSQNAMEFLQQISQQNGNASAATRSTAGPQGQPGQPGQQGKGQQGSESEAGAGQQAQEGSESETSAGQQAQEGSESETSAGQQAQAGSESEASAGQQATDGNGSEADDGQQGAEKPPSTNPTAPADNPQEATAEPEDDSPVGVSQNALQYLAGQGENDNSDPDQTAPAAVRGTLSINDLLNAQGVGNSPGGNAPNNSAGDAQGADEDKDNRDDEGKDQNDQ